jgi:hypothetical protein
MAVILITLVHKQLDVQEEANSSASSLPVSNATAAHAVSNRRNSLNLKSLRPIRSRKSDERDVNEPIMPLGVLVIKSPPISDASACLVEGFTRQDRYSH